ncbi:nuclear transport factor 2 family protein [Dasania marina]|uniref:nuclear transport factor 2 family protein n=1 Tax=Dasania marina TaxID=471499 RepID=UPI0030D8F2F8|tara:strand:+ start:8423 stop:8806 length:384 start_codon:yes stop_codon:yes gene_type:complete
MATFKENVLSFMGRFNDNDLEGALSDFTDDGQYIDEFGNTHQGKTEIRAVLTPIFDGSFGTLTYITEDIISDPSNERAMVTWTLKIKGADNSVCKMRGLDILDFDGKKVRSKNCYIKAREVLIEPID